MQTQSDGAISTGWVAFGGVSSAIFTGIALLFLWAIPQFTSDQVWRIEVSTVSVSIPLQLLGLWNGLVALAYLGLVPGLWTKNLGAYEAGLKLAQLNLFLTYLQTQQGRAVSLSDIFIMGGNLSLLLVAWGGKTLIAKEQPQTPEGFPKISRTVDVSSVTASNMKADEKIGWLLPGLLDENSSTRIEAVDALAGIGSPAVEPLIKALRYPRDYVRISAANALGRIGDARALPELERLAREEKDSIIASAATRAAGKIRDQTKD